MMARQLNQLNQPAKPFDIDLEVYLKLYTLQSISSIAPSFQLGIDSQP